MQDGPHKIFVSVMGSLTSLRDVFLHRDILGNIPIQRTVALRNMNFGTRNGHDCCLIFKVSQKVFLLMQDRVTIYNDADKKSTLDWLYFLLRFPPNVILISYLFPVSIFLTLTLTNIIEVVKNK